MADDRELLVTISPTTDEAVLTRYGLTEDELSQLGPRARAALRRMRKLDLAQRQRIVTSALATLRDRKDELGRELTEQMGRPISATPSEITTAVARGEYLVRMSAEALADTPGDDEKGFKRYIRKEPVGVVLIIFAWNYPYLILINSLVPALLAGNAVILKPSPQTPTIVEHIQRIFLGAGLPEDVIQYFHCGLPSRLEYFIRSSEVNMISFTGSVAGGLSVQRIASDQVIPVCLELGGKDPAYVRADVDVRLAAEAIVDGAVFNSGQSCCSIERVYVDERIHDDFVKAMQDVLRGYRLGDPSLTSTNLGPVISKRAVQTIRRHVSEAIELGAVDVTPENESFRRLPPHGNFVAPSLLINVEQHMAIIQEETFGPVIPVMKVKDDNEAVRLMNDCQYGLTASVWTKDFEHGEALSREIEAGTVFVNRCDFPSPDLAWTGWKNSGKGVTLSRFGFEQFVKLKSVHVKERLG